MRNSENQGVLRAYTYVIATDIMGKRIRRRVSLGTDWCAELQSAKDTMERVRSNNRELEISGEFKINL